MSNLYENFNYKDENFPIVIHNHRLRKVGGVPMVYPHWHDNIEILCFFQGEGIVISDTSRLIASISTTVVINSGHIHSILPHDEMCRYICIIIDKEFCRCNYIDLSNVFLSEITTDKLVYDTIMEIYDIYTKDESYAKALVKSKLLTLLVYLCKNYTVSYQAVKASASTNKKFDSVRKAMEYIQKSYTEDISASDVCSHVCYTTYYFSHLFKEYTGRSIIDYINLVRCDSAKKLLLSSDESIAECAYACGFRNLSHFNRMFKKHMGYIPSKVSQLSAQKAN